MNEFFSNLSAGFNNYLELAEYSSGSFWLSIFSPIVAVWILSKVFSVSSDSRKIASEGRRQILRHAFSIYRSVVLASVIVSASLIGIYIYLWMYGYYNNNPLQLAHLISLVICFTIGLFALMSLSKLSSREKIQEVIKPPVTKSEEIRFVHIAHNAFNNTKWLFIIPVFGFLSLFFLQKKQYHLVSFVLDTSSSMGSNSFSDDAPPIDVGKAALSKIIEKLDNSTDIILSIFEDKEYKENIEEIVAVHDNAEIAGTNSFFSGEEKRSAIAFVNTLGESLVNTTPLSETVWSNYIFTLGIVDAEVAPDYVKIVSIIITDGLGNLGDNIDGFLCENIEYGDFYSENAEVNIINLNDGNEGPFVIKAESCGYKVWEGFQAENFNRSLDDILNDFKRNWSFVIWIGIIYFIFLFFSMLIFPKQTL